MAKIVRIKGNKVYIGTASGAIKEFHIDDLDFEPEVGKEVEFYTNGTHNIIVADGNYNYVEQNTVNKGAYCWLAFLVGGLGLHKLYAKKYVAFLLYLVFCWTYIPALISLFDFLVGLFKSSDRNGNIKV